MDQLKDYHHNLDTTKLIEYSINQSIHQTSHMLTSESYHHSLSPTVAHTHTTTSVGQNKKLTSIGEGTTPTTSSAGASESSTASVPLHLHSPKSECSSIESSPVTTIIPTASGDSHRDHWYNGNQNHNHLHHHHPHSHPHPHHGHHHLSHQTTSFHSSPLDDLVYSPTSNASKYLDTPDGYLNPRYNVKGGRNERTSSVATSFFDIPAATPHHPYCYRFPSSTGSLLKKDDDGHCGNQGFSTNSALQLAQHFHNKSEHPDSTTNPNHHLSQAHKTVQSDNLYAYNHSYIRTADSSLVSSTAESELKFESAYGNGYTLRPIDSSIVSSTESELKFESLYANCNPISNNGINQRRGSLQLWQFLVALLDEPTTSCIAWTGRGMEFKLIEPEEVARRWGIQKNRPAMNYDKLSRSLRYYYEKGIMQKVNGERYVYRFVCDPDALFNMAYGHINNSSSKTETNYSPNSSKSNATALEQHLNINRETDQDGRSNAKSGPLFYSSSLQNHKY